MDGELNPISIDDVFALVQNKQRVFIKKVEDPAGGKGVHCWKNGDTEEGFNNSVQQISGNIVIQNGLSQYSTLDKLNSSSINTVRVLTFIHQTADVEILSAVVRMGRRGNVVDKCTGPFFGENTVSILQ